MYVHTIAFEAIHTIRDINPIYTYTLAHHAIHWNVEQLPSYYGKPRTRPILLKYIYISL